jgi:hypothetical protein
MHLRAVAHLALKRYRVAQRIAHLLNAIAMPLKF